MHLTQQIHRHLLRNHISLLQFLFQELHSRHEVLRQPTRFFLLSFLRRILASKIDPEIGCNKLDVGVILDRVLFTSQVFKRVFLCGFFLFWSQENEGDDLLEEKFIRVCFDQLILETRHRHQTLKLEELRLLDRRNRNLFNQTLHKTFAELAVPLLRKLNISLMEDRVCMGLEEPPQGSTRPLLGVEVVKLLSVLLQFDVMERGEVGVVVLNDVFEDVHELEAFGHGFLFDHVLVAPPDDLGD